MLCKNAVEIVKSMQRLREDQDPDDDQSDGDHENRLARRQTVKNLISRHQSRPAIGTLDVAFRKRFQELSVKTTEGE